MKNVERNEKQDENNLSNNEMTPSAITWTRPPAKMNIASPSLNSSCALWTPTNPPIRAAVVDIRTERVRNNYCQRKSKDNNLLFNLI